MDYSDPIFRFRALTATAIFSWRSKSWKQKDPAPASCCSAPPFPLQIGSSFPLSPHVDNVRRQRQATGQKRVTTHRSCMVEQSEPDIGANTSDICCVSGSGVCGAAGDTLTVPLLYKPQSLEDEVVSC